MSAIVATDKKLLEQALSIYRFTRDRRREKAVLHVMQTKTIARLCY
jgi:hypothetical protein